MITTNGVGPAQRVEYMKYSSEISSKYQLKRYFFRYKRHRLKIHIYWLHGLTQVSTDKALIIWRSLKLTSNKIHISVNLWTQ